MQKHLSQADFYTQKARQENYPARSIYKLKEINEKFGLIKTGDRVLDLGCSPGSWLLYISRQAGGAGRVVAIDVEEPKIALPDNAIFIKK
ncbi:MAG: 50S rRNA methyltransferase, partial [Patescibacteria group bacterium]|nr:50S rRNA methyltransferase [Patescibacteria group bacterium]